MFLEKKLSGGKVHRVDPKRPILAPSAEEPFFKVWQPGSLWASSGATTLIEWSAQMEKLGPRPTGGEVFIRELDDGRKFVCIGVRALDPERRVEFQYASTQQAILVRGLEQLFQDAGLDMAADYVYRIPCERIPDDEYGWVVAGEWTLARATRKKESGSGSAERAPDEESPATAGKGAGKAAARAAGAQAPKAEGKPAEKPAAPAAAPAAVQAGGQAAAPAAAPAVQAAAPAGPEAAAAAAAPERAAGAGETG